MSHFTIDDHLKRYSKALIHLSQSADDNVFREVLAYVQKHELYQEGLQLYKDEPKQYNVIGDCISLI